MADAPIVHIGENSPEEVALKLTRIIAAIEGCDILLVQKNASTTPPDRKWLLDTYAECLRAVQGKRVIAINI